MKLWDKGKPADKRMEEFTVGKDRELDLLLAPYDILGSLAHAAMLEKIGLLSPLEGEELKISLQELYRQSIAGELIIEQGVEDIHSQVEKMLTARLGDTGKKIHTARSRNDQVLLDIHLFTRDKIADIAHLAVKLSEELLLLSEQHRKTILPGYTHFQVAMPASFGLWFACFAESMADDLILLDAAFRISNQCPLGSAAGFGTSFPIDRSFTSGLLGFGELRYNSMHIMNMRGKMEKIAAQAVASLASTLSRLATDICLYMGEDMGFIKFPDNMTTGSSIMPHKKNPDLFELVRGKCNKLQALPVAITQIITNLPSGYHRDFQLIKEDYLNCFEELSGCLEIMIHALPEIQVIPPDLNQEKYRYMFSVEEVNRLVISGMPFREAYRQIAEKIENGTFIPDTKLHHTHEGSMGNLCNDKIREKLEQRYLPIQQAVEIYRIKTEKLLL